MRYLILCAFFYSNLVAAETIQEASSMRLASGSMLELIWAAGPMVKFVIFILVMFSILSWSLIVFKGVKIHSSLRLSREFTKEFWESHSLNELNQKSKSMPSSPLLEIFKLGYLELIKITQLQNKQEPDVFAREFSGIANIQRAMNKAKLTARTELEREVPLLATIGTSSPFIGLVGTVWGIVDAFHGIGLTGSANLATVAPGIAEALIATAVGLIAAIPAVIAYNLFVSKIKAIYGEMEAFSSDFLNIIERHFFFEK